MSKLFSTFWGNGRLIVAVVALALIPTVNRAPASKNSSNSSKKKFIKLPGAVRIQAPRASMKTLSIPIFPQHKFDFGDSVFVPSIQHGGIIKGILHQDDQGWQYCLSCAPSIWWAEIDLQPACPTCRAQWNSSSVCKHCGYDLDSLS
jgi:hypothetical protein